MNRTASVIVACLLMILSLASCSSTEKKETSSNTLYYCPMHPDQTSDHADTCKICGMDMIEDENGEHAHLMDSVHWSVDSLK